MQTVEKIAAGPVVVGFDGSAPSRAAVEFGAREAAMRGLDLELGHAFSWPLIYPPLTSTADPHDVGPRERERQLMGATASSVREQYPRLRVNARLVDGPAPAVLVDASRRATLMVVGHRGLGGFAELLAGSIGVQTATHGLCPVIVVRGHAVPADAPMVVGIDGSSAARSAAWLALEEARLRAAHVVVVFVPPPARTVPETPGLAGVVEHFPDVKVQTEVRPGYAPAEVLMSVAAEAGAALIVVGNRGVGGFRALLMGDTCRALIDHAPCPVATMPRPADTAAK